MGHYRIYHLDPEGRITKGENFEFSVDAEALAFASRCCADAPAIEVWQSARFIARLPGPAPARQPARSPRLSLFHRFGRPA